MKILVISDPHFDFTPGESTEFYQQDPGPIDAIVVAGDISNNEWQAEQFFSCFNRFTCPKYAVSGNHDYWWSRNTATKGEGSYTTFWELAVKHGFRVPSPDKQWEVVEGVLLFNLFYKPDLTWEQIGYTNDCNYFPVRKYELAVEMPEFNEVRKPVIFSVSHLGPNVRVPTKYGQYHPMFYNTDIDRVLRALKSPVHFFGHTHEWVDSTQDGVRYVNRPVGYYVPKDTLAQFVVEI